MENTYRSLSSRRYDLSKLTDSEQAFLEEVFALYRQRPHWDEFRRQWIDLGRERLWKEKVEVGSASYRICQDLAARLGIAEGKVAPPDYRDHLADLIEERFGSRYAFCKKTGIDQGHLSRVLAGKKHLASNTLFEVLEALGVQIDLVEPEEIFRRAPDPFVPASPTEILSGLEYHIATLRNLLAMAEDYPPEEQATLLAGEGLFDDGLEQVRLLVKAGRGLQEVVTEALTQALAEKARVAREVADSADEEREAHGKVAG